MSQKLPSAARGGGEWLEEAWQAALNLGLPLMLLDEQQGGFGVDPHSAIALIRITGSRVVPLPIAETAIANRALARANLPLAAGPASFVPATGSVRFADGRLTGVARRVPWGADVATLAVEIDDEAGMRRLVRLDRADWTIVEEGSNVARAPRPSLAFDLVPNDAPPFEGGLLLEGAAIRTLQMAGALDVTLQLTLTHVSEREQFGRTLSKFQVVQHELAKMAAEVAAASAAADIATDALAVPDHGSMLAIGASRIRCGGCCEHRARDRAPDARRDWNRTGAPAPPLHDSGVGMARRIREPSFLDHRRRRHLPTRRARRLLASHHFGLTEQQCAPEPRL